MRVLFLGDVVGRPGRRAVGRVLPRLRRDLGVGFVIANGENAAGGKGITPRAAEELRDAGVDVITTGNHVWQHREIVPYLRENERLLRPANWPPAVPGRGWVVRPGAEETAVGVVNLIGRVFMGPADCPFRAMEAVLPEVARTSRIVIVDMHAEATSEKAAMGRFLDGRVSAVVGTHTHVQTADEAVLPGGTAFVTDVGMCGPEESIIGMRAAPVIGRFLDGMPVRFEVAEDGPVLVQGVVVDIEPETGRAAKIARVRERVTP